VFYLVGVCECFVEGEGALYWWAQGGRGISFFCSFVVVEESVVGRLGIQPLVQGLLVKNCE